MRNFKNIFAFTFSQYAKSKRFIALTVILALIFFAAPTVVIPLVEVFSSDDELTESYNTETVYFCDVSGGETVDPSILVSDTPFSHVVFKTASTFDVANSAAENDPKSLIFVLDKDDTGYLAEVLLPNGSALTEDDAETLAAFLDASMRSLLLLKSGLTADQLTELMRPTEVVLPEESLPEGEAPDTEDSLNMTKQIISMALPFLYVMVLYFMLAFYGQGVATGVIVEKSSKLMDTFLVSVKPTAMVFGKMLAISLTGLIQFAIWVLSLVLGFVSGVQIVKGFAPETDMGLIQFFDTLGEMKGIFSVHGVVIAILFACVGFILYCSLAAIGGAISEKAEDLSSNNMIFALILAISFCATIYTNPMYTGAVSTPAFLDYIPFTAILTVPGKVLLGDIEVWGAIVSLVVTAFTTFIISMIAGKLYKAFALYKGKSLMSLFKKK